MKGLKAFLTGIYIVIIILLLLCFKKCDSKVNVTVPEPPIEIDSLATDTASIDTIPEEISIKESFKADVVMCIDCTSSMNNIINTIKNNAINIYADIKSRCRDKGKDITSMRIKVIGFRDYSDNKTFEVSDFFNMPEHEEDFKKYISQLKTYGGGDRPERGYDALSYAFKSSWKKGDEVHQVVILWTDADTHPLNGCMNIKDSTKELYNIRKRELNEKGTRLILFAPQYPCWDILQENLDNTTRHEVAAGGGLSDVDYEEILKTLSETI